MPKVVEKMTVDAIEITEIGVNFVVKLSGL